MRPPKAHNSISGTRQTPQQTVLDGAVVQTVGAMHLPVAVAVAEEQEEMGLGTSVKVVGG